MEVKKYKLGSYISFLSLTTSSNWITLFSNLMGLWSILPYYLGQLKEYLLFQSFQFQTNNAHLGALLHLQLFSYNSAYSTVSFVLEELFLFAKESNTCTMVSYSLPYLQWVVLDPRPGLLWEVDLNYISGTGSYVMTVI